jgi:hypothetical protein
MNMANLLNIDFGDQFSGITDSGINTLLEKFEQISNIILWIILGVLTVVLIIKGALLGVQIVKSADEPQVRQEKINSLKWLVIGIAIGYGIVGLAKVIISIIANNLK